MLTLFSTCKELKGFAGIHQRNALRSWRRIVPKSEVMVFGREMGIYDLCQELGFKQMPNVERVDGVPLVDDMFKQAQKESSNDLMCYLNGDVVVIDGLVETVQRIAGIYPDGFFAVCRRWDVVLDEEISFHGKWKKRLADFVRENGELHSTCSTDIFAFRRPLFRLPAFAVGRPAWDNWCMWKATDVGWPVVDMTPDVTLLHSVHGYGEDALIKQAHFFWRDNPLSMRNADLMGRDHQY